MIRITEFFSTTLLHFIGERENVIKSAFTKINKRIKVINIQENHFPSDNFYYHY